MISSGVTTKLNGSFLFLLIVCVYSCSNKPQTNLSVYRALTSSLNNSNALITSQNLLLMKSLEKKLNEASTSQKTSIWLPKAELIQEKSRKITEYIDSLKEELKKEAGKVMVNNKETFSEDDIKAVKNLFEKKGNGEKLRQQLLNFESGLLEIDPEINSTFHHTINTTIRMVDPSEDEQKTFTETFFKDIPTVAGLAVLAKFRNDVKILEHQFITFCANKIPK